MLNCKFIFVKNIASRLALLNMYTFVHKIIYFIPKCQNGCEDCHETTHVVLKLVMCIWKLEHTNLICHVFTLVVNFLTIVWLCCLSIDLPILLNVHTIIKVIEHTISKTNLAMSSVTCYNEDQHVDPQCNVDIDLLIKLITLFDLWH